MKVDIFSRKTIEKKYNSYLKELKIEKTSLKDNEVGLKEKILLMATHEYKNFIIDLDMFISILGMIWIVDPEVFDPVKQTKIEHMCHDMLDIQWQVRHKPDTTLINTLQEVLEYHSKNKNLITN